MAKGTNSILVRGLSNSVLIANKPATVLAELEPSPLPIGIFLCNSISIPTSGRPICARYCLAIALTVFLSGFKGNLPSSPVIFKRDTPGLSVSRIITSSPGSFTAKPRTSNPHTTLATVAGAKTFTDFFIFKLSLTHVYDICKYTCGSYLCSCSRSFNYQRPFSIPVSCKRYNVVTS
ncbi:hypothetical protein D3C87_1267110 [compost metagenome]